MVLSPLPPLFSSSHPSFSSGISSFLGYRIFTFDKERFPHPKALNSDLHKQGFKTVWMIDPGIKAEEGFKLHDEVSFALAISE